MVQSISQYEFIYEYILDYLASNELINLKFPRNTFGLEVDDEEVQQEAVADDEEIEND